MTAADNLKGIETRMATAAREAGREPAAVTLVVVSKTFSAEEIRPVIAAGHRVFGENRVQEAKGKWPELLAETAGIELHLIGPLQSNKAHEAVELFDVIHTIDRDKIASAIAREMARTGRRPKLFVQVNTGAEPQKAGVLPEETVAFVARCRDEFGLEIAGLMCIPPFDEAPAPHFALLAKLAAEAGVDELSMGMSDDFEVAIHQGATLVRVGSAIFGARPKPAATQA
ncbi:MAG TPA: YggS family pyridoxal phosphate-dependent enzyme [Kaistiaceae bacterium]|nr:YggS family pyridoxal phosphate-dependent enzyme [Kaistiaceae bacterium]